MVTYRHLPCLVLGMLMAGSRPAAAQVLVPAQSVPDHVLQLPVACPPLGWRVLDPGSSDTPIALGLTEPVCTAVTRRRSVEERLSVAQEESMSRQWARNAKVGALVGGATGAAGGLVLLNQSDGIGSPPVVALWGGLAGGAVGALVGVAWTAMR